MAVLRILFCFQLLFILGNSLSHYTQLQAQISTRQQYAINLKPKRVPNVDLMAQTLNTLEFETTDGILTPISGDDRFNIPKTFDKYVADVGSLIEVANNENIKKFVREVLPKTNPQDKGSTDTETAIRVLKSIWGAIKIGDMHLHMNATMPMKILIEYLRELYNGKKDKVGRKYMDLVHAKTVTRNPKDGDELLSSTTTEYTLRGVFAECGITGITGAEKITEEILNMTAPESSKTSFDDFIKMGTPCRNPLMKQAVFLIDGPTKGIHLANLIHLTLDATPNEMKEINLGLFGKVGEFKDWVNWVRDNEFHKRKNLKFKFQLPRLLFMSNQISYNEYLNEVFMPIFDASRPDASDDEKNLMRMIVGFDSVGEEEKSNDLPDPNFDPYTHTDMKNNPDYLVHIYYVWANIRVINKLRSLQNLNVFSFTPHCGEAGSENHFAGGFLLANYIGHGIGLRHENNVVYKQLYRLMRIGATVCPISNDRLYLDLKESPTKQLLHSGIIATIGTDDPTIFHGQKTEYPLDPLLVEYETIARAASLTLEDIILLLKNGALLSGFRQEIEESLAHPVVNKITGDEATKNLQIWQKAEKTTRILESERNRQLNQTVRRIRVAG